MRNLGKAFWLASAAFAAPVAASAAESAAEQERQYWPEGIIGTGELRGYGEDDGSTGTKMMPQCGFSSRVAGVLNYMGVDFADVNVLADEANNAFLSGNLQHLIDQGGLAVAPW